MTALPRRRGGATAALAVILLSACTRGGVSSAVPVDKLGPPILYVAVGASETIGVGTPDPLREAWPQVLFRTALPRNAVFVNLGISGATVQHALQLEAPEAVTLAPQLVTVWLNVNDLIAQVPAALYERELDQLISMLRRGGATRVLVANTPPLDHLPAYLRCGGYLPTESGCDTSHRLPPSAVDRAVAGYNAAIARVAALEGATVVDLHAVGLAARANGTEDQLVAPDGFHPSVTGAQVVAGAFAAALRRAWPNLPR